MRSELTKSFSSAADSAQQYPQYATQIVDAAKSSFLAGADWAYATGMVAVLVGAVIVFLLFPDREHERRLLAGYHAEDAGDERAIRSSA